VRWTIYNSDGVEEDYGNFNLENENATFTTNQGALLHAGVLYTFELLSADDFTVNLDSSDSLSFELVLSQLSHTLEAPGIYSLIGDRYVLLKCPEIESHLNRSRAYERFTLGLAKFKLAVMGYDESRFDFSTIAPREFHPIGKLPSLTFRFERPDGSLYNFRGINHTMTICIRFYTPNQTMDFKQSILAPSYNPDFFQYQQNMESSDEEN